MNGKVIKQYLDQILEVVMSILKKLFLVSLIITGSFYADSNKSDKSANGIKSSIVFMKNFLKEEAMPISMGILNVAAMYKIFGKEFAALGASAVALCVVRMYMDKKHQQLNAKKSE